MQANAVLHIDFGIVGNGADRKITRIWRRRGEQRQLSRQRANMNVLLPRELKPGASLAVARADEVAAFDCADTPTLVRFPRSIRNGKTKGHDIILRIDKPHPDSAGEIGTEAATIVERIASGGVLVDRQDALCIHCIYAAIEIGIYVTVSIRPRRVRNVDFARSGNTPKELVSGTVHDPEHTTRQHDIIGTHRLRTVIYCTWRTSFEIER